MSEFMFDSAPSGLIFAGDSDAPPTTPDTTTPPTPTDTPDPITASEGQDKMVHLGDVYHVEYPTPKHVENSPSGVLHAAAHHMSIDLDMQIDSEGNIWNTHWERPMEKDGFRHPTLPKSAPMNRMTPAQIRQLQTKDGTRIHLMSEMLTLCAVHHVKVRAEPKADARPVLGWTVERFKQLRADQLRAGAIVVIATLTDDEHWRERMANARKAGFPDVRRL